MTQPSQTLDVTGMPGPAAIMKARRQLISMAPGAGLTLIADDHECLEDVASFCFNAGHRLIMATEEGETIVFKIERGRDMVRAA